LPLVRAAAVGWVPLSANPISVSAPVTAAVEQRRASTDGRLRLNISGQRFEAWRCAVDRFPDTLLGSDEKEFFFDTDSGEYFFDRDPDLFRYILAFYRTGRIHYPRHECVAAFDAELQFFGVRHPYPDRFLIHRKSNGHVTLKGQGRDTDTFEAQYLKTVQDSGLVSTAHL